MHTAAAPCRIASRSSLSVSLSRPARPSHHTHSRTLPPPRPPHPRSLARSHTHAYATTPRRPTHPPTQPSSHSPRASTARRRASASSPTRSHTSALSRAHSLSHSHTLTRLADDSLAHPTHTHLLAQPMHAARLVLAPLAAGSRGGGPRPSRPDRSASHQRPLAPRQRSPRDREHHRPSRPAIHHRHEQHDAPRSPAARRSARAFACTHTHTHTLRPATRGPSRDRVRLRRRRHTTHGSTPTRVTAAPPLRARSRSLLGGRPGPRSPPISPRPGSPPSPALPLSRACKPTRIDSDTRSH